MTVRIERIGDQFAILLTQQQVDALCLPEDAEWTVEATDGRLQLIPRQPVRPIEHVSVEESMAVYKRTEPKYADVYRELAK